MSNDPHFDKAISLIDEFGKHLLTLNEGKAIPKTWAIRLKKAITPAKQRRGRKSDYQSIKTISRELTHHRARLTAPDRTSKDRRGDAKAEIAKKTQKSIRTVERVAEERKKLFAQSAYEAARSVLHNRPLSATPKDFLKAKEIVRTWEAKKRNSIDPEKRRALIEGISASISEEITARQRAQKAAKQVQARRKSPTN